MTLSKPQGKENRESKPKMSTNHLINENEIIEASKKNPRHFKALYEAYSHPILSYINHKVNDLDEASDIASNVFYKALLNIKKYKDRQVPFSAWLYKIAYNETMQFFRKTRKMQTVILDEEVIENLAEEIQVENKELLLKAVLTVFEKLKKEEIEIIEQKFFQQKTNREIAFILDITEGHLKVKTHRIIQKIKKLISESNEQL